MLESAIKFINLTVPSSAGRIALNIRFLQKLGVPTGEAVASGAVDGISDTIVQIVLVLLILPFVDLSVALPNGGTGEPPWHLIARGRPCLPGRGGDRAVRPQGCDPR